MKCLKITAGPFDYTCRFKSGSVLRNLVIEPWKRVLVKILGRAGLGNICADLNTSGDINKDLSQGAMIMASSTHSKICAGRWLKL